MDITASAPQRFDLGRVVQRTFGAIGRNLVVFLLLGLLLAALPGALFGWAQFEFMRTSMAMTGAAPAAVNLRVLSSQAGFLSISGLTMLICAFTLQASAVHATVSDLNGRKASLGECLSTGLRFFFPLLGLTLLMGLALMLGFILLIVPGIMMAMAWIVAIPAEVVERTGVVRAFGRSAELTRGHRWAIFALVLVYIIAVTVVQAALMGVTGAYTIATLGRPSLIANVVVTPLIQMLSIVGVVGTASIYYELRSVKEGIVPETLASVFD